MLTTERERNSMVKKKVEKQDWGYVKLVTAVWFPVYEEKGGKNYGQNLFLYSNLKI
jgi:hypothetical protein